MIKVLALAAIAIILISATVIATSNYTLSKGYVVTINGTSNLHDWNETVGTVTGSSNVTWNTDGSLDLTSIKLEMNVASIKSTEGSTMDNNTYKALKGDADPEITIVLTAPIKSIQVKAGTATISAPCNFTIAGVTKPVKMSVKVTSQGQAKLEFDGEQTIEMTDYGISPPTALFGALKTGNEIKINFKTSFAVTNN